MLAFWLLAVAVLPSDAVVGLVGLVETYGVFVVILEVFVIVSVIEVAVIVVAEVRGIVTVVEGPIVVGFTSVRLQQKDCLLKRLPKPV